jgi:hypothetical protein
MDRELSDADVFRGLSTGCGMIGRAYTRRM